MSLFGKILGEGKKTKDTKPETIYLKSVDWDVRYDWIVKAMQTLGDVSAQLYADIPKTGEFKKQSFALSFSHGDQSKFIVHTFVEPDYEIPEMRRLSVGVSMQGSDICVSNYVLKGTREEILAFLRNDFSSDEMLEKLQKLLDKLVEKI